MLLLEKRPRGKLSAEQNADDRRKLRTTVIAAAVCGTILFGASTLQQMGAQITKSPGRAGFITDLYIILTPLFATLVFRRKLRPTVFAGAVLALAGIYLLCIKPGEGFSFGSGEMLIFLGSFFWAFHILAIDRFENISPAFFVSSVYSRLGGKCTVRRDIRTHHTCHGMAGTLGDILLRSAVRRYRIHTSNHRAKYVRPELCRNRIFA